MEFSVLTADQFSRKELSEILATAQKIENTLKTKLRIPLLEDYLLASLFFEPSTRTRLSFESAMHRLGGRVVTSVGMQFSSLAKGETLFDTLKMIEAYCDICVIRHPVEGASLLASRNISIPVINAGDGTGEHPSQALLDLYTINEHFPLESEGAEITIAFIGDLQFGRTIHSLLKLLTHYKARMIFISPEELKLPDVYKNFLDKHQVEYEETESISVARDADIAYVTRIQEERFVDHKDFEKFKDSYIVDQRFVESCREKFIVMHPLPRLSEVSTDLDDHKSAVYFKQAQNGLFTRMALLLRCLNVDFEQP